MIKALNSTIILDRKKTLQTSSNVSIKQYRDVLPITRKGLLFDEVA